MSTKIDSTFSIPLSFHRYSIPSGTMMRRSHKAAQRENIICVVWMRAARELYNVKVNMAGWWGNGRIGLISTVFTPRGIHRVCTPTLQEVNRGKGDS